MESREAQLQRAQELKRAIFMLHEEEEITSAILHLAWNLGLNASEISALRWENLNLTEQVLRLNGRKTPIPAEVCAFFSAMERNGPYVIVAQKSSGNPTNRGTVSRRIRAVLDAAGLPEVEPKDLRDFYILQQLEQHPIEKVSRITGLEVLSLQKLYRRHKKAPLEAERRGKTRNLDISALQKALEQEGDTLGSRVILLSWQGGLRLREMQELRWGKIDLDAGIWLISGKKRKIPPDFRPILAQWQAEAPGYILRTQSANRVEQAFLARRASEFFVRYGMEEVSLASLRGRVLGDTEYQEKLLVLISEQPDLTVQ